MTRYFLGLDGGSTSTKAVLFDDRGAIVVRRSERSRQSTPAPGHVERDLRRYWDDVARLIRGVVEESGIDPVAIAGVGIAGQGDGLCLLEEDGAPVADAVLSSDTRAASIVERWALDGTLKEYHARTGLTPFPGAPAPLLAWLDQESPNLLERARWAVSMKDWLRYCLTGRIGTDRTDGSASFVNFRTETYDVKVPEILGIRRPVIDLLPPLDESTALAGGVDASAAVQTGLREGTPVSFGVHDGVACILGAAGVDERAATIVAGTFGVNVALTPNPVPAAAHNIRLGPTSGTWTVRRTSSASTANVDWVRQVLGEEPGSLAIDVDRSLEVSASRSPHYLPYLTGGKHDRPSAAAFLGVREWHGRDDLMRAVIEGVTFTHRLDLEAVREVVEVGRVHLTGGASSNPAWCQLFADVLDLPVLVAADSEAGARGAAITAAAACAGDADLREAVERMRPLDIIRYAPNLENRARLDRRFEQHRALVETLTDIGRFEE